LKQREWRREKDSGSRGSRGKGSGKEKVEERKGFSKQRTVLRKQREKDSENRGQ
jgi:hypothetical protein